MRSNIIRNSLATVEPLQITEIGRIELPNDLADVPEIGNEVLFKLTSEVVSAYVGKNALQIENLTRLISNTYNALADSCAKRSEAPKLKPAVPVGVSVKPDYVICLEDGKKFKVLTRHLRTSFNMSPEEYRARWGLPPDYPMIAPNYARERRELALRIGLGHRLGRKRADSSLVRRNA